MFVFVQDLSEFLMVGIYVFQDFLDLCLESWNGYFVAVSSVILEVMGATLLSVSQVGC